MAETFIDSRQRRFLSESLFIRPFFASASHVHDGHALSEDRAMPELLFSPFVFTVSATHPDGSTFEQRFGNIESAFACRHWLLAEGWTVVTVDKAKYELTRARGNVAESGEPRTHDLQTETGRSRRGYREHQCARPPTRG